MPPLRTIVPNICARTSATQVYVWLLAAAVAVRCDDCHSLIVYCHQDVVSKMIKNDPRARATLNITRKKIELRALIEIAREEGDNERYAAHLCTSLLITDHRVGFG